MTKTRKNTFCFESACSGGFLRFNTAVDAAGGGGGAAPAAAAPSAPAAAAPAPATAPAAAPAGPTTKVDIAADTVRATASLMTPPADAAAAPKPGDWFAALTPELQGNAALAGFKDKSPADMAAAYAEAQAKIAAGSLPQFPGADATAEQKAAFETAYRASMLPPDASGYKIEVPEGLSDPVKGIFNPELATQFATFAHEAGLTQDQVAKLVAFDAQRSEKAFKNGTAAMEAGAATRGAEMEAAMKQHHGANYDKVIGQAGKLIEMTTSADEQKLIAQLPQAQRMAVTNMLHKITKDYIGEDKIPFGGGGGPGGGATSDADLAAQHRAVLATPAYQNAFDPGHAEAVRKSQDISRQRAQLAAPPPRK